jgi:tetratricopeptide (TPR) repeat protein
MDRHDEAAAMFEEVLRRNPNYVPAYQQLGYTYRTLGRDKEAAAILTEGMHVARAQGDSHASAEMQEALDELH